MRNSVLGVPQASPVSAICELRAGGEEGLTASGQK